MEAETYVTEDDMPLFNTGFENGDIFSDIFKRYREDVEAFLHRDEYIPVRGTTVLPYELKYLNGNPDIDGIVIEWDDITSCSLEFTHLQVTPKGVIDMKFCYPILRKHLELQKYHSVALEMLRVSLAAQIFYTNGWETWWGFIPRQGCHTRYKKEVICKLSFQAMLEMRCIFQRKMKDRVLKGRMVNTGAKNNLSDLSRMFVLPDDRQEVLDVFQSSMNDTCLGLGDFRKIIITFRFGEKRQTDLPLPIISSKAVARLSAHIGLSISFDFTDQRVSHLFWCREGIQALVGNRGILTPALSFVECANYQSNLDGRLLSISRELRNVCQYPEQLTFIQLYSDTPHRYPKTRVHPVSAAVIVMKGFLKNRCHLEKDAKTYVEEVENNIEQLRQLKARLEIVSALPTECKLLKANKVIQKEHVWELLMKYPLLAPFIHRDVTPIIKGVGRYVVSVLKRHLAESNGSGDSNAVWNCFQAELAVEKLLWGRPLCYKSNMYSVNLGPGIDRPSRSSTDAMGFLCLDNPSSCCVDEFTTPPLSVYSTSACLQRQITKVFGLINSVGAGNVVIGKNILTTLLKDLFDIGNVYERFEEFRMRLASSSNPGTKVIGGKTRKQISDFIVTARKAKYPMVIVNLLCSLKDRGVDITHAFEIGIEELQLRYFPAVRIYDEQRNAGLYWKWSFGLWVIIDINTKEATLENKTILCTALVVCEVERRKLFHSSSIEGIVLPWIRPTIKKLDDLQLNKDDLVTTLVFVTCIARLMQGLYVDYKALSELERTMPVSQNRLRVREILSKLLLQHFYKFRLWRLHHSIPFQISADKSKNTSVSINREEQRRVTYDSQIDVLSEPPNKIEEIDGSGMQQNIIVVPSRHLPTNCNSKWSHIELGILGALKLQGLALSDKEIYSLYQRECASNGISDRPFQAFRRKLSRM